MRLIIIRGIPGSGKSSFCEEIEGAVVISADDHFVDPETDEYEFKPEEIGEAHAGCFRRVLAHLQQGVDVVVDNTNVHVFEMAPYVLLGQSFGAEISIFRIVCDPEVAAERNVHGVPKEVVLGMAESMEPLLPFWPEEIVVGAGVPEEVAEYMEHDHA